MKDIDWENVRRRKWADVSPPDDWPQHLKPLSLDGLGLFALDLETNDLYWDGRRVRVERKISLNWYQTLLATAAAIGALLSGIHPFGSTWGWW